MVRLPSCNKTVFCTCAMQFNSQTLWHNSFWCGLISNISMAAAMLCKHVLRDSCISHNNFNSLNLSQLFKGDRSFLPSDYDLTSANTLVRPKKSYTTAAAAATSFTQCCKQVFLAWNIKRSPSLFACVFAERLHGLLRISSGIPNLG